MSSPPLSDLDKYQHLRTYSAPYCRRLRKEFPYAGFLQLINRLQQLNIQLRFDLVLRNRRLEELNACYEAVGKVPRSATTVVLRGRPPLIVMAVIRDDTRHNRLDTVLHESIHATGLLVNRFEKQPSGFGTPAYMREEFVAIYGAICLADRLGLDLGERRKRSAEDLQFLVDEHEYQPAEVAGLMEDAERAADFLAVPPQPSFVERLLRRVRKGSPKPSCTTSAPSTPRVSLRPPGGEPGRVRLIPPPLTHVRIEGRLIPIHPRRN